MSTSVQHCLEYKAYSLKYRPYAYILKQSGLKNS